MYALTPAKSGIRLTAAACTALDPTVPSAQRPRQTASDCGFTVMSNTMIRATHIDMSRFVGMLTVWVGRTVVDRTGFREPFDVDLKWNAGDIVAGNAPVHLRAVTTRRSSPRYKETLGLKLEATRGPVEVLVIDRAEEPTGN